MFSMFASVGVCAFVSVCICVWVYVRVGGVDDCEKSMRRMCKKDRKDFANSQHSLSVTGNVCTVCTFDHIFVVGYLL